MTKDQVKKYLKEGRPGTKVLVKGDIRTIAPDNERVEVQFDGYAIWVPIRDIQLSWKKKK